MQAEQNILKIYKIPKKRELKSQFNGGKCGQVMGDFMGRRLQM